MPLSRVLIPLGNFFFKYRDLLSPVVPAWWQKSPRFEPHGGVLPDLRGREISWALLLGVLVLSFLVAPRFWLGLADWQLGNVAQAKKHLQLAMDNSTTRGQHDLYAAKLDWLKSRPAAEPAKPTGS